MKKLPLFLFAFFRVLGAYAQPSQDKVSAARKSPATILREVKASNAYLIDVRTPEEYGEGHLVYAKTIDFRAADFKAQLGKLDRGKPVYLYCRSGNRSGKAVDTPQTLSFKAVYTIGGFADLQRSGLPTEA